MKSLETRCTESDSELDVLACQHVSQKNRHLHRGGYSPYQLVFGASPRFTADLLSGDPTDLVGLSDRQQDAVAADEAAASVARQHEIRQGA